MAEMNVPDEAWTAADTATEGMEQRSDILAAGVAASAPLIVAAELERLSHELIGEENPNRLWRAFLQRAAQLRGGAS